MLLHIYEIESQLKFLRTKAEKKFEEQQEDLAEAELNKISGGFEAEFEYNLMRLQDIAEESNLNHCIF